MRGARFWVAVVACFLTVSAHARLQFIRVADTSTAAPGGTGTFTSFDPPSSNREALPYDPIEISFRGVTSTGVKGVYAGGGTPPIVGIGRVVDSTLPMRASRRIMAISLASPVKGRFGQLSALVGRTWACIRAVLLWGRNMAPSLPNPATCSAASGGSRVVITMAHFEQPTREIGRVARR